jgi:hypothetical protein
MTCNPCSDDICPLLNYTKQIISRIKNDNVFITYEVFKPRNIAEYTTRRFTRLIQFINYSKLPIFSSHFQHRVHSKTLIFSSYTTPILSIRRSRTRTRSVARIIKRNQAIHLFIGFIRYIFNCFEALS